MNNTEAYVKLDKVSKIYKMGEVEIRAVDEISFEISKGEFVVIVGPSGAGKTTVLNILGGMDTASKGKVLVDGRNITDYSGRQLTAYRRDDIGFVFQFYNLVPNLTALENVELPLTYAGVAKKERRERALQALTRVGLEDRVNFQPNQLSGGQKQRVAIARALVNRPKILLADEPTGALDSTSGEQVMELFQKLNDEGVSVLMITHDPEIAAHAKRVVMIRDGELQEKR